MRVILSNLFELAGVLNLLVGAYLIDMRVGMIVAGVVGIILGLILDPPRRPE